MTKRDKKLSASREQVFQAIQDSWSIETCGSPDEWSVENPSWHQCDVSAFVAWEYLGGDLVLGKVCEGAADAGYHYWNRIDGVDFDLTRIQFTNGESISEVEVLKDSFVRDNAKDMKPDVRARIDVLSQKVRSALIEPR